MRQIYKEKEENNPRVEGWMVSDILHGTPRLFGKVYNDNRAADGNGVRTSEIVGKRNGRVLTKSGSLYTLGEPHPEYQKLSAEEYLATLTEIP